MAPRRSESSQGAAELRVVPGVAGAVPAGGALFQRGGIEPHSRGESRQAVGGLDPALCELDAVVLAPGVALDDLRPAVARMLVVERPRRKQRMIANQIHRAGGG